MDIEVHELEGCKRRLDIEIPSRIVNEEMSRASEDLKRVVRVPGFRPGRVPTSIIRQRYKTELRQEALRNLLPSVLETAVTTHGLRVVGEPNVEQLDFTDDGAVKLAVVLEVFPDFTLADYKGFEVTKKEYKAADADVERVVDEIREASAQLVAVDDEGREAADGDFVSVDIEGTYVDDGEEHAGHQHEPIKADDVQIEIGGKHVQPEFTENLRGLKVGETKTFRVSYPKDASAPEMAGHTVEYTARLATIRVREVPEFDDELASEQGDGEYETAEALREAIREDLERQAAERSEVEFRNAIQDRLLETNVFPVPESLQESQAKSRLQWFIQDLAGSGIDPRTLKLDWAAMREAGMEQAAQDVRLALIIDRIAENEKVEPTDEEVEAEIERLAERLNQPVEQLRARLTKDGGVDSIRNQMRSRKALDLVVDAAKVTVEEVAGLGKQSDEESADEQLPDSDGTERDEQASSADSQ